jgi:hypothetical protein
MVDIQKGRRIGASCVIIQTEHLLSLPMIYNPTNVLTSVSMRTWFRETTNVTDYLWAAFSSVQSTELKVRRERPSGNGP